MGIKSSCRTSASGQSESPDILLAASIWATLPTCRRGALRLSSDVRCTLDAWSYGCRANRGHRACATVVKGGEIRGDRLATSILPGTLSL